MVFDRPDAHLPQLKSFLTQNAVGPVFVFVPTEPHLEFGLV